MGFLRDNHISEIHHYAPLHYLPFIARVSALLGKPSLAKAGFGQTHLRSKSSKQDVARGFGQYAFLTLDQQPRILKAKLAAGFPHMAIGVPAEAIDSVEYSLCRFNVAMTRFLRRGDKPGFDASPTNGRYYRQHQIPVAQSPNDKAAMLRAHSKTSMIEVLIDGDLPLPNETRVQVYAPEDLQLAERVLATLARPWRVELADPPGPYPRSARYARSVVEFVDRALAEPEWRGNGLEFDRV